MNFSGRVARNMAVAALGLLVMTFFTLDGPVLVALAGALATAYVASIWSALASRRHVVVVLGATGTAMAVAFALAFLRTLGLAINQDAEALGAGVVSRDADIYFYLATVSGLLTLAVLLVAAMWPARKPRTPHTAARPRAKQAPARKPAARQQAPGNSSSRTPAPRNPAQKSSGPARPVPKKPAAGTPARKPQSVKPAAARNK